MPAYHSSLNEIQVQEVCRCGIYPLKTSVRGPAPVQQQEGEDVVDETIKFFRANVMFRNFEMKGPADRVLCYLTLFVHQCLVICNRVTVKTPQDAQKELHQAAISQFQLPGDAGFPLGGMLTAPKSREEADLIRAYFKQLREETALRIIGRVFDANGQKSKWWMAFSKRKFMNKELR